MHEAYQPVIDDGRGRFPEDLRVKAPRGASAAIAAAAQLKHTTLSEYVRQAPICQAIVMVRGYTDLLPAQDPG